MKILIHAFILFIYIKISIANKFKNSEIYEVAKELLNSFALIDKSPISINNTFSNSPNNDSNILKNDITYIGENRNKKNSLRSSNKIATKKVYEKKTEVDILREEFLRVLQKNRNKNNFDYNINNTHLSNKNNTNSDDSFRNFDLLHRKIEKNLTSNITKYSSNFNNNAYFVNFPNHQTNAYFDDAESSKKHLNDGSKLNINSKVFRKNQTTFIEINSDISQEKNQMNLNKNKYNNTEKENKKLLLLQLKNLMEKYIEIKNKKNKQQKGFLSQEKNSEKKTEKQQIQVNSDAKIDDQKTDPNTSLINPEENKSFILHNQKEKIVEQNLNNEIINNKKYQKFLINSKDELSKNNEKKLEGLTEGKHKDSPKNSIAMQLEKVIGQDEIRNKQSEEIIKVTNEFLRPESKNASEDGTKEFIPLKDCNKNWDYKMNGDDWQCLCSSGKKQSPIDLKIYSEKTGSVKENIFFDFKEPEICHSYKDPINRCKFPIIKNNGRVIDIDDNCGKMIMPHHLNGYKCFKISLHTPAEHKLDGKQFDLEIKIHFKLEDKRIVDQNTMDYVILVVLVRGVNEHNAKLISEGPLINHPFLDQLRLNSLPKINGQAQMLPEYLDYSLLFNKVKQPYKLDTNGLNKEDNRHDSDFNIMLNNAFNYLAYDKHFPLDEYFIYNGSFATPPCEENVTYIINPNFIYAPFDQILSLTQVLILNGNVNGNNRRIQSSENIKVYHFKKSDELETALKDLDLFEKKDQRKFFEQNGYKDRDLQNSANEEEIRKSIDLKYIDNLLNSMNNHLLEFMNP